MYVEELLERRKTVDNDNDGDDIDSEMEWNDMYTWPSVNSFITQQSTHTMDELDVCIVSCQPDEIDVMSRNVSLCLWRWI